MASVDDVIAANATTMSDARDPAMGGSPMTDDAVMDGAEGTGTGTGTGTHAHAHARGRRDRGRGDRGRGDRDRDRGRFDHHRARDGGRFRERAPTRPGWHQTGNVDQTSGRLEHSGQCEGCGVSTVVNFRPVVGGNPPLCGVCLDSLKAATAAAGGGGVGEDRAGGPHRDGRGRRGGGRGGGFGGGRGVGGFHPYGAPGGGQIVMVDPRMMAAYGAGPGGAMLAPYGGAPGVGAGRGKNRSWTRDGAAAAAAAAGGEHDVDTSGIPCIFFQRGSCRAGDACKYSHGGGGDAVGGGGDAAMSS